MVLDHVVCSKFLPHQEHESLTNQTCTTMTYRFVDAETPIDQYEALDSNRDFLCVEQARGGTFGFTSATEAGPADLYLVHGGLIGTQWCNTCVGVFFRVDKHRSFVTHANAWRQVPTEWMALIEIPQRISHL